MVLVLYCFFSFKYPVAARGQRYVFQNRRQKYTYYGMVGTLLITFIAILLDLKFLQMLKKVNSNNGDRWQLVETGDL